MKRKNSSKPAKNKRKKPVVRFFRQFLGLLNVLTLLVLLASAYSDYVSPYRSLIFPYLGLFFPFILLGNILLLCVWLFLKNWRMMGLNFLVLLVCFPAIHTYFPLHLKTKEIPENSFKLLTYNVMRFESIKRDTPDQPNKILQYIKDADADVVCLQEYGAAVTTPGFLKEKDILKAMKNYPYHFIHYLHFPYQSEILGLAIFSKFPILSTRKVPYESDYNGSFVTELDIHGKKVTLINNHLESNKLSEEERNNYYKMTQEIGTQSLDVFTKTMTKRLSPAYKIRALQAQLIADIVAKNKNPYIIVCGDFNDTPISYARHKIKGNLCDAFVDSGFGLGITYNKYRFLFRIDYILYGKNIKSYNCTVGKLRNSDHYPVWCYLELK
ncbi:MAG: endonuclease/exonuclease/phosphatase family protein [Candidatus Symbiothrix sp.]|jgi:endonuclease/exonuclease/phosphatase family metal-dependent hydrolase|nr:endonuclease/exonuclease/phosphatase family protein [Candidatus Symbiothrix sp.]